MRPSSSHAIRRRTHGLPGAGLTRQMIRQRSASSLRLHHRHDHWFADAGLCQSNEGLRGRIESPLGVLDLMDRSEEHTSELQSLAYLVCRLLLEKKKK